GTYPNKSLLAYTLPPNKYRIPDDYMVETTWGRSNNRCVVQCFINYIDNKPVFQIWFGKCFEHVVSSVRSATDVTNLFHKEYTSLKKTKTSGIYLFGLHLKTLEMAREGKRRAHILKPIDQCGNSTLTKRAMSIGKHILAEFNEKTQKLYNLEDVPALE
ncbi:10572_t:CDS:2, partial [Rhizophagus irregularis]